MRTALDTAILDQMESRGGSFIRALSVAARYADQENLSRIKTAWADEWDYYRKMIPNRVQRFEEAQ